VRKIVYRPPALNDLRALYDWIDERSDAETARNYTRRLRDVCRNLSEFPNRGTPHPELMKGLRTVPFERRATIAYRVAGDEIEILRILHGGRDLDQALTGH
jgi:toxin ParE1/3/4